MVSVDGLSLGNLTGWAADQSRYSALSCFAQKARSASSVLNSGTFFSFGFINRPLLAVHVSRRNDADQSGPVAKGERHM